MGGEHLPAPGCEGAAMRAAARGPSWPPPPGTADRGPADAAAALGAPRGHVGEFGNPRPSALADVQDVRDRLGPEPDRARNRERERAGVRPAEGVRAARDEGAD
ncbi:MAG TPA: hypothetical protein VGP70_09025 [Actinomadura sp.]|jgi:hypothetical protein|nr:hypothetical protein [Actinomadura sp.]